MSRLISYIFLIFLFGGLLSSSCKKDFDKVSISLEDTIIPDISMDSALIKFTDSAKLKIQVTAPVIDYYSSIEKPYTEFPKGLEVLFYDRYQKVNSSIRANYAINYEKKELWKAKGDVVAVNDKGDKLNTEEMFWNQKDEMIYSDKFSKITTEDGTYYGKEGFEADQNLEHWVLKGSSGLVNVETDEEL